MNNIEAARNAKGLSQKEVAITLKVSQPTVSNWEAGRKHPAGKNLIALSRLLGVPTDYLLGNTQIPNMETIPADPKKVAEHDAKMGRARNDNLIEIRNVLSRMKFDNAEFVPFELEDSISFPVIGEIKAGYNGTAQEEYTGETVNVTKSLLGRHNPKEFFVLRVSGNSMYPQLLDGDYVLVKRESSVDSGKVAVILYNYEEECTIKKLVYDASMAWLDLVPANPEYEPKRIQGRDLKGCRILGRVIGLVYRKL